MNRPVSENEYVRAFGDSIETGRVSPVYVLGLMIVAIVMVLLPLIYVAMIIGVGYLVYFHTTQNTSILTGSGVWWLKLVFYFGPIVVGLILIFFMIRPLFAVTGGGGGTRQLRKEEQPVLFAFVEQICECVGAPFPKRIDVDCQVNASASFRRGLFSFFGNDLVLTVGVPLVKGLDLRQFAGVLAHEFGHFTQGVAMRLSYVIRSVNLWFARVVGAKDSLDQSLDAAAKDTDIRIGVVLHVARVFVFLTSKVLWILMMFGHMISSFMLRQMEFDADKYEIQLAGSDAFASTAIQLQLLGAASQISLATAQRLWLEGTLPNDLAALTTACVAKIPADMRTAIEKSVSERETKWFDTHPSDKERIGKAEKENAKGIFRVDAPASAIFQDFEGVCRAATESHYEWLMGGQKPAGQLVSTEDAMTQSEARREEDEVLKRFFLGTLSRYRPVQLEGSFATGVGQEGLIDALKSTRERMARDAWEKVDLLKRFEDLEGRKIQARLAKVFLDAGLQIEPKDFGLMEASVEEAKRSYGVATVDLEQLSPKLDDIDAVVQSRLEAAFELLREPELRSRIDDVNQLVDDHAKLLPILSAMGAAFEFNLLLHETLAVQSSLLANLQRNEDNPKLAEAIMACARDACDQIKCGLEALSKERYPFAHAGGEMTVAEFILAKLPESEDIGGVYEASQQYLDKFAVLYLRVLARLAAIAESVESAAGLPPMSGAVVANDASDGVE